jgi:hypothetical protein
MGGHSSLVAAVFGWAESHDGWGMSFAGLWWLRVGKIDCELWWWWLWIWNWLQARVVVLPWVVMVWKWWIGDRKRQRTKGCHGLIDVNLQGLWRGEGDHGLGIKEGKRGCFGFEFELWWEAAGMGRRVVEFSVVCRGRWKMDPRMEICKNNNKEN